VKEVTTKTHAFPTFWSSYPWHSRRFLNILKPPKIFKKLKNDFAS